jgi:tetratricopeptide (TPR) repeat protein
MEQTFLYVVLGLGGLILIGYLPASWGFYWMTRLRGGRQTAAAALRIRDIAGMFGERPTEHWRGASYLGTVAFATLIVMVGFALAYPATLGFLVDRDLVGNAAVRGIAGGLQQVSRPLFFGFLGAYLFTLQITLRRYLDSDLNPDAYFIVATRMLLALIVAGMMGIALPSRLNEATLAGVSVPVATYVVAFVVGIFPENGLDWLVSFARSFVPMPKDEGENPLPLQTLSGLTRWHAIRLNVAGVANVQNLANADHFDLIRRTRFSVQQIMDWVDQAILLIHLADAELFKKLQKQGLRGFSDFQISYINDETRAALEELMEALPEAEDGGNPGFAAEKRLVLLYTTMQEAPNVDPVRLYWRYKSAYLTGSFDHFNRGRVYEELGEYQKAITAYDAALDKNPLDTMLLTSRGQAYGALAQQLMTEGQSQEAEKLFQKAISDFTQAIQLDRFATHAYAGRGEMYLRLSQPELAEEDFSRVLAIAGRDHRIYNRRAVALQMRHRYARAVRDLKQALRIDGQHAPTYVNLANTYVLQEDYVQAEKAFTRAIEIDSSYAQAFHGRGRLHLESKRYDSAIRDFQRALELEIDEPEAVYLDWGRVNLKRWEEQHSNEQLQRALGAFRMAITLNRSYAPAYGERALAYRYANEPAKAVADYTVIIDDLGQEQAEAYVNRGLAFLEQGEYEKALVDLTRGIDLDPQRTVAFINRGIVYQRQEKYLLALSDFARAIDLQAAAEKPSPEPYNNRGNVYSRLGRYEEAIADFDQALKIDPAYAEAYNNRGETRLKLSPPALALAEDDFSRAIQLARDPVSFYNRGLVRLGMGNAQKAKADFSQALEINPQYISARVGRATAYIDAQEFPEARQDLDTVLQQNPDHSGAVYQYARLEAASGNHGPAIDLLSRLKATALEILGQARSDPAFDDIRDTPGFAGLWT